MTADPTVGELRSQLNQKIEATLEPLLHDLKAGSTICLIDPPGHQNVGDSAILVGELDYLSKNHPGVNITFYDVDNYSDRADRHISKADVLLVHGGGNFGDIWLHHHRLRMRMLERFSDRRIIQFPQSIHFSDQHEKDTTARLIAAHKDFTLLVRDVKSLEFAEKNFDCDVKLAPDMAFAMKPIERKPARLDYFCLLRTDKEVKADHSVISDALRTSGKSYEIKDWLDDTKTVVSRLDSVFVRTVRWQPQFMAPFHSSLLALRRGRAAQRVSVGINLLSQGAQVITDRLHAHIMCCLLGIPNVVFDSYDGKISAFHQTWTSGRSNTLLCKSADGLAERLEQFPT